MNRAADVKLRLDKGDGKTLLFLHGWLMSGRVWGRQLPLAEHCRMLTVDLPGHGESHEPHFSYADCVESIIELFDTLGCDKVCPIGWSMGAQIALQLYQRAPERLSGLVLVSGTPLFCRTDSFPHGLPLSEVRSMDLRIKRNLPKTAGEFFSLMFSPGELPRAALGSVAADLLARLPELDIASEALRELTHADLRDLLSFIDIPTLLIHGALDRICLPGASRFMSDRIPGAAMICFEEAGHAPFISAPEKFNSAIKEFTERLP